MWWILKEGTKSVTLNAVNDVLKAKKRILFLSINTDGKDVRDGYTYNFVTKEMERLVARGESIYFFSVAIDQPEKEKGVLYDGGRFLRSVSSWQLFRALLRRPRLSISAMTIDWRRALWSLKVDRAIYNMAKFYEIDAIHTHFFFPNGMAGMCAAQSLKIPLMATMRGAELHNRPELDYGACRDPLFRRFLSDSIPHCYRITAPNKGLVKRLIQEWDASSDRVEYLPNGVDFQAVGESQKGEEGRSSEQPLKIIAVGRLIRLKDHLTMIKAVEKASQSLEREIRFTLVGDGPLSGEIKQHLFENQCRSIDVIDEVSKEQLFKLMEEQDLLLHASLMEGMPNVVLEALSLGVPCVVSDIPGHREIIQHGINGYIFPVSSVDTLADLLIDIAKNPARVASMAPSCMASINDFTLDEKISRYQELYRLCDSTNIETEDRIPISTGRGAEHHGR